MAAPPEWASKGQTSSRKAADWTILDSELFAGSLGSLWVLFEQRELHRRTSPSKGLWHNFGVAQLCRDDRQPGTRSPSMGRCPRVLAAWRAAATPPVTLEPLCLQGGWYQGGSRRWYRALWESVMYNITNWWCKGRYRAQATHCSVPGVRFRC